MTLKLAIATSLGLVSAFALAELSPVSPINGSSVARVPDAQKKVMALPTLAERLALLGSDANLRNDPNWQHPAPLVLKLNSTAGEKGPWKVMIGKSADLSDARKWYFESGSSQVNVNGGLVTIEVPRSNLELGTRYYWQVVSSERCGTYCPPDHDCAARRRTFTSSVAEFVTEDCAPRWIEIKGDADNIRDLGGRVGLNGQWIRQGFIFRGEGLNDNSVTGEEQGDNRLTVMDVKYLKGTLGIKTDLDLRSPAETADLAESPLGPDVRLVIRPSDNYAGVFSESGMHAMAENFREFCDPANYPIYIHCISGADRTGSLVYMLYGILGVSQQDAETDWESTFYPYVPNDPNDWKHESHFTEGLAKYGSPDDSWNRKVELYLKDCGVTDAEIAAVREKLLDSSAPVPPGPENPDVKLSEKLVAFGEKELWLGPDEIVEAIDEITFALLVFRDLPANPTREAIIAAINASGAVDKNRILEIILAAADPVAAYRAFQAWAEGLGDLAVAKDANAGDSFAFGTATLFANVPKVQFSAVAASATEPGALDVAVTVKDGDAAKPVSSARVAEMFEATSDVTDWTTPEKQLEPHVTDRTGAVATPVEFTVRPGDGTKPKAFLRLRK